VLEDGETMAYHQPASDQACFRLAAEAGSEVTVEIYNVAYQEVARFRGRCAMDGIAVVCESVRPLAPGIYIYRARAGGRHFAPKKLWVGR